MEKITTIGLDIAKHVFQVHGINGAGATVSCRKLRRDDVVGFFKALPPCLIGIEACATGHHWARGEDIVQPHQEAGYTSAVVTNDPDPADLLQSGGVHIRPYMPLSCHPVAIRASTVSVTSCGVG